jgi:DNA-directed RNA polymerase subunit omega
MARVTVEDCLEKVPNRFALTVLAARRARALSEQRGTAMVECDNKEGVTALREVAAEKVRYVEDVETVVRNFIEEQRTQLRSTTNDNTFLEAVPLSMGDDDEDEDVVAAAEVGDDASAGAAESAASDAATDADDDSNGDSSSDNSSDSVDGGGINIDEVADDGDDDDDDDDDDD